MQQARDQKYEQLWTDLEVAIYLHLCTSSPNCCSICHCCFAGRSCTDHQSVVDVNGTGLVRFKSFQRQRLTAIGVGDSSCACKTCAFVLQCFKKLLQMHCAANVGYLVHNNSHICARVTVQSIKKLQSCSIATKVCYRMRSGDKVQH